MRLAALLFATLLLAGCRAGARDEAEVVDLIVGDSLVALDGTTPETKEGYCADESHWGLVLGPDQGVAARVRLGREGRIELRGCLRRRGWTALLGLGAGDERAAELAGARLQVRARGASGTKSFSIPVPELDRAFTGATVLEGLSPGPLAIEIEAEVPPALELLVWDAALRHRVPSPDRGTTSEPSRQILLISVDTMREDAISAFGGPYPTPGLDAFVGASEAWRPHYAAGGWTKPSHASLLTGESPVVHRVDPPGASIPAALPTLAERLHGAGLATAGLVFDCRWLSPDFGFARGFDRYDVVRFTLDQQVRVALDWMKQRRDQPFFYFLHTFYLHSDFSRLPYEGRDTTRATVAERFGAADYGCDETLCASARLRALGAGEVQPVPNEERILRFLYGGGVEDLDASLAELFAGLRDAGMFDRLLIVLTSDHGEGLLERPQAVLHGPYWEQMIRVPMLVKWPGGAHAGEERRVPTSALDLVPTLLDYLGLDHHELPGTSFSELRDGDPERAIHSWGPPWQSVSQAGWKAVFSGDLAVGRLYGAQDDPLELVDRSGDEPERFARLRALVAERAERDARRAAALADPHPKAGPVLTPEERRRLEALGYVVEPE